jgi:hypothetical protein
MNGIKGLDRSSLPGTSLENLFVPAWKRALSAAAPLLLVALLLGPQFVSVQSPTAPAEVTRVEATKSGGEVVFMIANGDSVHHVYKSNDINMLESVEITVVTQGAFRDRLESDSDLVFYRID